MATKKHKKDKHFFNAILCLFVALSFLGTLLVPIASASKDTMPCCVGKSAGHCDSGIAPKKIVPPPSEPMCGLHNSESADDAITIVAEPSPEESHHHSLSRTAETTYAAESIALSQPCPTDCGACATSSTRQQRREQGVLQPITNHNPSLTIHSRFQNQPSSFSSNEDWEQISPRGPPVDLL